ncbi:hypothetical protein, partial [Escherichia coli]
WLIRLLILGSGYNTMISHLGLIRTFPKNIHYLNALSEILFLSPVVSGHSGYFSRLFYFCYAEVL